MNIWSKPERLILGKKRNQVSSKYLTLSTTAGSCFTTRQLPCNNSTLHVPIKCCYLSTSPSLSHLPLSNFPSPTCYYQGPTAITKRPKNWVAWTSSHEIRESRGTLEVTWYGAVTGGKRQDLGSKENHKKDSYHVFALSLRTVFNVARKLNTKVQPVSTI